MLYSYLRKAFGRRWRALAVRHGILGILARGPRHGYELKSECPARDEVFVRVGLLLGQNSGAIAALLESHRRVGQIQLAELTRQKMALGRGRGPAAVWQALLLDSAVLHTEADLKWLELCEHKLRGGASE